MSRLKRSGIPDWDVKIKIEPTGIILRPTSYGFVCPEAFSEVVTLPVSTNSSSTKTSSKSVKVFEQIFGVISEELLSVLPGNPLQVLETIVSEYGASLSEAISGESASEILIHGKDLLTMIKLEDKLNVIINDKAVSEDIISDVELQLKESDKSLSSLVEEDEVTCLDSDSPIITRTGREVKPPSRLVCETEKVGNQQKSTPVKIVNRNDTIPSEKQQKLEEKRSPDSQTVSKQVTNDSKEQESTDDDHHDGNQVHHAKEASLTCSSATENELSVVKRITKRKIAVPVRRCTKSKRLRLRSTSNSSGTSDLKPKTYGAALNTKQTNQSKLYKCTECSFQTSNFEMFVSHREFHEKKVQQFKCSQCDYTTTNRREISGHEATHSSERFTCDLCPYEAHLQSLVHDHRIAKHKIDCSGQKCFECPTCARKYTRQRYKLFYTHLQSHPELKDSEIMKTVEALIEKSKEKSHVCDVCGYQTRHQKEMNRHRSTVHSENRPCLCDECGKAFKDEKNLKTHRLCHIEGGRPNWNEMLFKYFCTKCSFRCKSSKGLKRHQKGHDQRNGTIYKCPDCDFSSLSQNLLSKHTIVHCDDRFNCNFCPFQTHLLKTLKNHVKKKHKDLNKETKYYHCPSCDFEIADRNSKMFLSHLQTHPELKDSHIMKEVKEATGTYKCCICEFKAHTMAEVTTHKNSEHPGVIPYMCKTCGESYKNKPDLRKHRIIKHQDIDGFQQYSCNVCDKKFITEGSLKRHQTTHGPGAAVFCGICEAGFPNRHQLLKHMRVFHNIGTPCPQCNKRFTTRQGLNKHIKTYHLYLRNYETDSNISDIQSDNSVDDTDDISDVTSKVNSAQCEDLEFSTDYEVLNPIVEETEYVCVNLFN